MNSLNAEIMNLIIFILVFLVLYFNLVDTNQYLKNFLVILVIGYFGLVDLKYGLLLFILYMIDLNNKSEQEDFFILNNIKNGINKVGKSMANLGKKKVVQEEEEQIESFTGDKENDTKEDFGLLQSVSNKISNNETFKSLKKYAKNGARNILKSIQEEESVARPEDEEEEEEENDDDDIENFEVRKKRKSLKENLENNFLLNQLKKNDVLDSKLENFQGKIANKLDKINKIITKFKN